MAEGDGFLYNSFKAQVVKAEHNFNNVGGHTFKVALFTSTLVPDRDTHSGFAQLTGECSGAGYIAGGKTILNLSILIDSNTDTAMIDADNVTWNNLGQLTPQPKWAVLYNDSHASKGLIACWEVATLTNGGNWEIQFSSSPSAMFTLS